MSTSEQIEIAVGSEAPASSVAWGAIIAGAVIAAAVSLTLMVLGSGLGLTLISPWAAAGTVAATLAVSSIIWLIVVQWIASGVGGYVAGRLRTRWAGVNSDEVFFRDTAHGFATWALSTLVVAGLLTSAVTAIVGGGAQVAATAVSGAAQGAAQAGLSGSANPLQYYLGTLYRPATAAPPAAGSAAAPSATVTPTPAPDTPAAPAPETPAPAEPAAAAAPASGGAARQANRQEAYWILANGLARDEFPAADRSYLADLIARGTGLATEDAAKRVDDLLAEVSKAKADAQAAAETARKAGATASLFLFLSLIIGAFIASVAAALGGNHRDDDQALISSR